MSDTVQVACPACLAANRVPAARVSEEPKCGKCGAALLDGAPAELREEQFEPFISRTELPVLADFWAPWCGPCRAMAPQFERAAKELKDRVRLVKVNTEEAQALAARYGIRAIPTLVLFRNGAEVKRASGAMDAGALVRWAA
ncbi:MAG: thioredoxin TrxC [Betaproteobacteria bacterium]|nr:thioredoxin TrxC [Betaproteobacteria bacterium]